MKNNRVNEIDLLRFFAALSVVIFHYTFRGYAADSLSVIAYPSLASFTKYSYLGVELFFMISGFVILMTAANGSLRRFLISRIVRLYPAFWACCTLTFLVIITFGDYRYSVSLRQYLINMTMLSEFVGVASIDGVYWSLFVEMRFYILVSVLLLAGKIQHTQFFLMLWWLISVALEVFPIWRLRHLLIVNYSAYFIAGASFFLIWSQGITVARISLLILAWGLAIFESINALPEFEKHYNTTMNHTAIVGIVSCFFIIMLLVSIRKTGFWGRSSCVLLGSLTYPVYLLHQNIGFIIFNTVAFTINPYLLLIATLLTVIGLAYLVHIIFENRLSLSLKNTLNTLADNLKCLVIYTKSRQTSAKTPK
jgi:peptidoglycan/LPS O-acetylase OafA/YrhL